MKRILVIEDDVAQRLLIVKILTKHPLFFVIDVDNGKEALGYLNESIDLVVADYHLSRMSGGDVLKKWLPRQPDTHFVFLTGETDVHVGVEMIKHGATEYLTKPIEPNELLSIVSKTLGVEPTGME